MATSPVPRSVIAAGIEQSLAGFIALTEQPPGRTVPGRPGVGDQLWCFRQQTVQGRTMAMSELHPLDGATYAVSNGGGPVAARVLELCLAANGYLIHKGERGCLGFPMAFLRCGWMYGRQRS